MLAVLCPLLICGDLGLGDVSESDFHVSFAATLQLKVEKNAHSGTILSVAFAPDGRRIASGSADRTLKVWGAGGFVFFFIFLPFCSLNLALFLRSHATVED